jgi:hypothetical protein
VQIEYSGIELSEEILHVGELGAGMLDLSQHLLDPVDMVKGLATTDTQAGKMVLPELAGFLGTGFTGLRFIGKHKDDPKEVVFPPATLEVPAKAEPKQELDKVVGGLVFSVALQGVPETLANADHVLYATQLVEGLNAVH